MVPTAAETHWRPSFVYHGARYWQVDGLSDQETDAAVGFEVMRADNPTVGTFSTSDSFLDRLHRMIDRAVRSNMYSVFTDCPHREKLGWLEAQTGTGLIPSTAPEYIVFDFDVAKGDPTAFRDDSNWGRAIIEVPWNLYRHYGDPTTLRRALPSIKRYLDYLESRVNRDGVLDFGLGDWIEDDDSTPRSMVATHGWAASLSTDARTASLVGEQDLAAWWQHRAAECWERFRQVFRSGTGVWGSASKPAGHWLGPGGLDDDERASIIDGLLSSIDRSGATITVGEIALPRLIRALTDSGNAGVLDR